MNSFDNRGESEGEDTPLPPLHEVEQSDAKANKKKKIDILIPYALITSIYVLLFSKKWYPSLLDFGFSLVFALIGISCFIFPEKLAGMKSWRNEIWEKMLGRKGLVIMIKYFSSSLCILFAILMITNGAEAILG